MNREDVLRMAWEADKFANKSAAPSGSEWWQLERDTHLAALVAAEKDKKIQELENTILELLERME